MSNETNETVEPVSKADQWESKMNTYADKADTFARYVTRACSARVIITCVIAGLIVGGLAGWLWSPLQTPVSIAVMALAYVAYIADDDEMVKCYQCGKRVKIGYKACHHCGYTTDNN